MKIKSIIGLCIIFSIVLTVAYAAENETLAESLYAGYDTFYSDGSVSVTYTGSSNTPSGANEAGLVSHTFSITGSGTYDVVAIAKQQRYATETFRRITTQTTGVSPGSVTVNFDGNYLECGSAPDIELLVYQNNILKYQDTFITTASCSTNPVKLNCDETVFFSCSGSMQNLQPVGSIPYSGLTTTLDLLFAESGPHSVGVYISDGKGNVAYDEKAITSSIGSNLLTFNYPASAVKRFNLTNDAPLISSILVDGQEIHACKNSEYCDSMLFVYFVQYPPTLVSTSEFANTDLALNNVTFDTSHIGGGKITELGMNVLLTNYVSGSYSAEISLENIYGEYIDSKQFTISNASTSVWFNGTDIYNSKINGPYRAGFLRVWQGSTEYIYELGIGESADLAYTNFTSPLLSNAHTADTDITGDAVSTTVTVTNPSTKDAAGVTISLFDAAAQKIGEVIIATLTAGQSLPYAFSNPNGVLAIVDFNNNIEETDETDNVAFRTIASPPLIISSVVHSVTNDTARINWTTDRNANTTVNYGLTSSLGTIAHIQESIMSHSKLIIVAPNTTYYYNVTSCDTNNNCMTAGTYTFTTTANPPVTFLLRVATLDMNYTTMFINSTILINGIEQNSTDQGELHNFTVLSDTVYQLNHSSPGYNGDTDTDLFDAKLTTCTTGSDCSFTTGSYVTICQWQAASPANIALPVSNSWYCSVEGGSLPEKDWFRYVDGTQRYIRRFNYLVKP